MAQLSLIDRLQALLRTTTEDQQGILFGRPTDVGVEVLSCRPLATFTAGEIAAAIGKTGDPAVGFYRIREGTSLELSREETEIATELFSKPGSLVLLIERRAGEAEGCFFFQESGVLLNYPLLRFPVDSAELARREAARLRTQENEGEPSVGPSAASRPVAAPPSPAGLQAVPIRQSAAARSEVILPFGGWRIAALIFGGAAVGLLAFLLIDFGHRRAAPSGAPETVAAPPATPLKAERQGADLKITWDLNSPAVVSATSGLLNIDDGGVTRQLVLSPEQVRFGGLLYSPASDHVSIRLTTLKDNQSTSEASVVVLLTRASSLAPPSPPRAQPAASEGVSSRSESESGAHNLAPSRPFVPPAAVVRTAPPVAPQELPTVQAALPHVDVPLLPVKPAPPPAVASGPAERAKVGAAPEPAVLIYDPGVIIPPELKQMIDVPVNVRVRVAVDAAGRVTRAEGLREGRVHALLLKAATEAALRCRFRPARLGDTPVPSEVTIKFTVRR